jgi:hypothetical protein
MLARKISTALRRRCSSVSAGRLPAFDRRSIQSSVKFFDFSKVLINSPVSAIPYRLLAYTNAIRTYSFMIAFARDIETIFPPICFISLNLNAYLALSPSSRFRTGILKNVKGMRSMPYLRTRGRLCQSAEDMTLCSAGSVPSVHAESF